MDDDFLTDEQSPSLSDGGDSAKGLYNTVRPSVPHRATQTFRARLTFFFALTAAMTAVILSLVLAFTWEGQFQTYTRTNMQRLADSTADVLATQYEQQEGWTRRVLTYAKSASTASNDMGVQVLDEKNEVIYDDTWALSRRSGYTGPTPLTDSDIEDDSMVTADVITSEGDKVGTVRLWAFGSDALLTKSDEAFRQHSYQAIFGAAGIAVLLACVIGYFTSRKLTRPIKIITSTAAQIRSGDLTARTNLRGEDEIGRLGETFDSMATTLEHDIKIEHRLTSDVAHELRTPLMAMLVTVEAMQDGVLPADFDHLETVASETRRLSRLVDAMLHLSRIENGKGSLKVERTDMVYLVRSLVSAQHQLFHEKGLHLRFANESGRDELYADVDPDLIREALINLMSNAMRYTSSDGWVLVAVAYDRPEVIVSVQDTGIGIAKEDVSRIFTRFWRSDASRERVSGGLGVGLAITKEIIDQHNGTILVEAEQGKGTTFSIRIPQERNRRTLSQAIQEG